MEFCLHFQLTCHCDPDCDPDRVTLIVKCMVITARIGQTSHKNTDFSFSGQAIARKMLS